jgi:hypothetical protein
MPKINYLIDKNTLYNIYLSNSMIKKICNNLNYKQYDNNDYYVESLKTHFDNIKNELQIMNIENIQNICFNKSLYLKFIIFADDNLFSGRIEYNNFKHEDVYKLTKSRLIYKLLVIYINYFNTSEITQLNPNANKALKHLKQFNIKPNFDETIDVNDIDNLTEILYINDQIFPKKCSIIVEEKVVTKKPKAVKKVAKIKDDEVSVTVKKPKAVKKTTKVKDDDMIAVKKVTNVKRKPLKVAVRNKVWNMFIGINIGQSICFCCNEEPITKSNFECGHIQAFSDDGDDTVNNLRPICGSCNKSIGTENMETFMYNHGFEFHENWYNPISNDDIWNTHLSTDITKHICMCCKKCYISQKSYYSVHIISIINGGNDDVANLRPSCQSCNVKIKNVNLDDYIIENKLFY